MQNVVGKKAVERTESAFRRSRRRQMNWTRSHDSFEHVARYSSVASQLRQGEFYPRWLANMNAGLGSPVLFVYAPLPYFVPGFLSPLLRLGFGKNEPFELGVSVWLALALSGISDGCGSGWL
jgi:hypothetical protein